MQALHVFGLDRRTATHEAMLQVWAQVPVGREAVVNLSRSQRRSIHKYRQWKAWRPIPNPPKPAIEFLDPDPTIYTLSDLSRGLGKGPLAALKFLADTQGTPS